MASLNDMAGVVEETVETLEQPMEVVEEPSRINEMLNKILTSETGTGSVESYRDHAMNFNSSLAVARILRGLTGIIGSLNLAIIDIGIGLLEFTKTKKVDYYDDNNSGVNINT